MNQSAISNTCTASAARCKCRPSTITHALWWIVAILLLASAFRFLAIDAAPPGWRDDELIEYNMDRRIADGWRPLFIAEAEGHEPFYHYLHAGTILLFGDNIIGYKWLPFACGLLSVALTYALARKMFDGRVALLAAALMAVSFWPVMYARFGVRHIGVLPLMLGAFYLLYPLPYLSPERIEGARAPRPLWERVRGEGRVLVAGILLAAGLMTYFAGRAVPIVLAGFLVYLLIFRRSIFKRVWRPYLLAIGLAALIALPMFIEIARTPGGEKRTEVVGGPLLELRQGNVKPAMETTLGTLGMFTFAGDPEWLYNIAHRPVFDWSTGIFFYLGVVIGLVRLKRIESGFVLAWLIVGIAPAFVSIPAASFSHTISAQPVMYVLAAVGVVEIVDKVLSRQGNKRLALSIYLLVSSFVIGVGAWLTLRDYFGTWAHEYIVRFQYHGPTREVARWLDQYPEITAVAIGTDPNQIVLDPLALKLDLSRDLSASWFNAETVVARPANGPTVFTAMRPPSADVKRILSDTAQLQFKYPEFDIYVVRAVPAGFSSSHAFDDGRLVLGQVYSPQNPVRAGKPLKWLTYWQVEQPLAHPRLKMFLHVLNDRGEVVIGDDREDLNFATLTAGAAFWQISQVTLPNDLQSGQYQVEVGWYNPETGERLKRDDGSNRLLLDPIEISAP